MKTGEVARRIDVSDNSVRNWTKAFGDFLSKSGRGGNNRTRRYDEEDVITLATIAELRNMGLTFDAVRTSLESGKRVDSVPPLPNLEEDAARKSVELVPLLELQQWQFQVEHLRNELQRVAELHSSELDRIAGERDTALSAAREAAERIAELEREAGILQGRIEEIEKQGKRQDKKKGLFR